jgi:hypothetical protein
MNSTRPDALASLRLCGEAKNGNRPVKGVRPFRDLSLESAVSSKIGMHGVVGDRMVGSWSAMNQGSRTGKGTAFMVCRRPEELYPGGDRASVVAQKRGNARGAKGGREVATLNKRTKETAPSMSDGLATVKSNPSTRTFHSCAVSVGRLGDQSLPLIEPERSTEASADLLWS